MYLLPNTRTFATHTTCAVVVAEERQTDASHDHYYFRSTEEEEKSALCSSIRLNKLAGRSRVRWAQARASADKNSRLLEMFLECLGRFSILGEIVLSISHHQISLFFSTTKSIIRVKSKRFQTI